jgi:signal transduction histidine kinase
VQTGAFALDTLVADASDAASLYADASGCALAVPEVDPLIGVTGNRELLLAALVNLLQNAFKFTHPHTEITLSAYVDGDRVLVDVKDNCGGLPAGTVGMMFKPFTRTGNDRNGLGLGLSIAKRSVEASGGALRVRDVPGIGCIFTMDLPRQKLQ